MLTWNPSDLYSLSTLQNKVEIPIKTGGPIWVRGRICQITQKRNESKATMESLMPVSTMNPVEEIFSRTLLSHFAVRKAFTFHWRMVHPKVCNDMDLFFKKTNLSDHLQIFLQKNSFPSHQPTRPFFKACCVNGSSMPKRTKGSASRYSKVSWPRQKKRGELRWLIDSQDFKGPNPPPPDATLPPRK